MDIRPIEREEIETFLTTFFRTMGFGPPPDPYLERERRNMAVDRTLATFDSGVIVGTTYSHLFELTLPGGAIVPAAGVTAVCAASTHRRRGIVTELMRRQLVEARDRGEPAALLLASEGRIYRRFGYGVATYVVDTAIDTRDLRSIDGRVGGTVSIVDGGTADKVFPEVHDRARRGRAGSIHRPTHFWESASADRDKAHVHLVYENDTGEAEAYARYGIAADWKEGLPAHKLTVHELTSSTDDALRSLWAFLLNLDLVREVEAMSRPIDDPVRWMLAEPRALRSRTYRDMYWLRPLDVARLLGERRYAADVDLRFDVTDDLLGDRATYAVRGGCDGAEASVVDGDADIRLGIAELGSLVLGGVAPSELARAGRMDEVTSGAVARADLAFLARPAPWGNTYF